MHSRFTRSATRATTRGRPIRPIGHRHDGPTAGGLARSSNAKRKAVPRNSASKGKVVAAKASPPTKRQAKAADDWDSWSDEEFDAMAEDLEKRRIIDVPVDVIYGTTGNTINPKKDGSCHRLDYTLSQDAPGSMDTLLLMVLSELGELVEVPLNMTPLLLLTSTGAHHKGLNVFSAGQQTFERTVAQLDKGKPLTVALRYRTAHLVATCEGESSIASSGHTADANLRLTTVKSSSSARPCRTAAMSTDMGGGEPAFLYLRAGIVSQTDEKTSVETTTTRSKGGGIRIAIDLPDEPFDELAAFKRFIVHCIEQHKASYPSQYDGMKLHTAPEDSMFMWSTVASKECQAVQFSSDFVAKTLPAGLGTKQVRRGYCLAVPESAAVMRKDSKVIRGVEYITLPGKERSKTTAVTKQNEMKLVDDQVSMHLIAP